MSFDLKNMLTLLLAPSGAGLRGTVDSVLRALRAAGLQEEALGVLETRNDIAAMWLRASLLESRGSLDEAAAAYSRVVDGRGCEIPDVLLQRARLASRAGDFGSVSSLLRLALRMQPDYSFFLRAEALAKKCQTLHARSVRVALLGSSTTSFLRSALSLLFFRDGIEPEFYEAPFGAFQQEVGAADSALYRFAPDFVILLVNWRDAGLPGLSTDPDAEAAAVVSRFRKLWDTLRSRCGCHLVQTTFDVPMWDSGNALTSLLPGGRLSVLREINRQLTASALNSVTLLDTCRLAAQMPVRWHDPIQWSAAKFYPAPEALPFVAEQIASCMRAVLGLSSKLVAVDLDNTLWGGVVGEDGIGRIDLGSPSARGERYQEFQHYLKGLKERGILLAVVSKNNREDAMEVFERHPASVLKLEDFVAFHANWEDKPRNLRRIASDLKLGLDSFVFLDDNPTERARVRAELPEVIVPEISGEPVESIAALEYGLYFQAVHLTEEDRNRADSYSALASGHGLDLTATSPEEYLQQLQMVVQWGPVDRDTCARVTQLINKTNQFNLTVRRYTEEQVTEKMASADWWCRWFRLRDRFADHGLIAVLLVNREDSAAWVVDSWLMSCRVIGRGVEQFMFNCLSEAARKEGADRIRACFVPGPKNAIVRDLLPALGFTALRGPGNFEIEVQKAQLADCVAIGSGAVSAA